MQVSNFDGTKKEGLIWRWPKPIDVKNGVFFTAQSPNKTKDMTTAIVHRQHQVGVVLPCDHHHHDGMYEYGGGGGGSGGSPSFLSYLTQQLNVSIKLPLHTTDTAPYYPIRLS